jgi:UDPglucose 6-dehydrogenase
LREAPSIALITALQDMGARICAYDPVGMEQAKQVLADVTYCRDPYDCVEEADAVVIVTEWDQFRALDLERVRDLMACPVMVDLRNVYMAVVGGDEKIALLQAAAGHQASRARCTSRWRLR